tara:strand:+ start:1071 stop:1316 length:246 start_codon:yes stop_codon:yes gene_type:complete
MFDSIKAFFVAKQFVANHGNRFMTVYVGHKRFNGQIVDRGFFKVSVKLAHGGSIVRVSPSAVVRVHRDKKRLAVQKQAIAI